MVGLAAASGRRPSWKHKNSVPGLCKRQQKDHWVRFSAGWAGEFEQIQGGLPWLPVTTPVKELLADAPSTYSFAASDIGLHLKWSKVGPVEPVNVKL